MFIFKKKKNKVEENNLNNTMNSQNIINANYNLIKKSLYEEEKKSNKLDNMIKIKEDLSKLDNQYKNCDMTNVSIQYELLEKKYELLYNAYKKIDFDVKENISLSKYILYQRLAYLNEIHRLRKTCTDTSLIEEHINIDEVEKELSKIRDKLRRKEAKELFESLNDEKKHIFHEIENSNDSFLITGKAGTGKSYLLKAIKGNTNKKMIFCAPTGIAAVNIEAATIHKVFRYIRDGKDFNLPYGMKYMFKMIDSVVIDEISMVRADMLNQISIILQKANNNSKPFGGKQMILFGDLFQLPPVVLDSEYNYLMKKYGNVYFFNSPWYQESNFKYRELKEIFRQKDDIFIDILNRVRSGNSSKKDIQKLNERFGKDIPENIPQLVTRKFLADKINENKLNNLPGEYVYYDATVTVGDINQVYENDFPCIFNLKLKKGALVLFIKNDVGGRWVNGTFGTIEELYNDYIKVNIDGVVHNVTLEPFTKERCEYNQETGTVEYIKEIEIMQFPVVPGYSMTIHKSQGQTYESVAINVEKCFATGQAYVAISRCKYLDKLHLNKEINLSDIMVDPEIVKFYEEHFNN